jgi:hypothetical protein
MDIAQIKEIIKRELPAIVQEDAEIQQLILRLARTQFADKMETENRFDRLLDELRRDREEQNKKWEEQNKRWEEQNREQNKRWEEQNKKWEEQNRKWGENQGVINQMLQSIRSLSRKHDSTIGALGARWGIRTEQSFRNALKSILEESFAVEVQNIIEFDPEGYVFGHPDQVELDLIIKDGLLIICEIKSSMSRSDIYTFGRKVEFYEKGHNQRATRKLVISPMVDESAQGVAKKLGIEVYSYAEEIEEL